MLSNLYLSLLIILGLVFLTILPTGFWGGLVPENAFNANALEALLNAGVLGLKVSMSNYAQFSFSKKTCKRLDKTFLDQELEGLNCILS